MIYEAYCLYDTVAGDYAPPTYARSLPEYSRSLAYSLRAEQSGILCDYPSDFRVYHVGSFDSSTGLFTPVQPLCVISNVADLRTAGSMPTPREEATIDGSV